MVVILGLIILIAAVVVAVAGVLTNFWQAHHLTDGFSVFGYVTGSTGTLFLYGIAVGALAVLGLSLRIAAVRCPSHHARTSRRDLGQPGRQSVADRNDAIGHRQAGRAELHVRGE